MTAIVERDINKPRLVIELRGAKLTDEEVGAVSERCWAAGHPEDCSYGSTVTGHLVRCVADAATDKALRAAEEHYKALEERLAEVRRRVITDFYHDTARDSPRWVRCRLCFYVWRYGDQEVHDKGCPMEVGG